MSITGDLRDKMPSWKDNFKIFYVKIFDISFLLFLICFICSAFYFFHKQFWKRNEGRYKSIAIMNILCRFNVNENAVG